jgi:O-antigen/teichoic acid export membrane protein
METLLTQAGNQDRPKGQGRGLARRLSGLRARVAASMGALLVGQGVTAGIQLLSLPLYLHFWDAPRYGKWVLLTAVPAYFSMSDAGLLPVAANRINMLYAAGKPDEANTVFQSALALVLVAIAVIAGVAALVLSLIGGALLDTDSRVCLWLLIVATLCGLFGGLYDAGFRAYGRYARGVLYANGIRVLEFAGIAVGLSLGASFTHAALGLLAGRVGGSIAMGQYCRRAFPQLRWGLTHASGSELRELVRPALTFMAFPLGNALSIQAITLIVGALFGTVVVAMFNTYRTLSRLILQIAATFGHALWAEFSRLYGAGDRNHLNNLYGRTILIGGVISVLASLAMIPMAPLILNWWTHGKIAFDAPVFICFALVTLVGGLSVVPRVLLMSTNRHSQLGVLYLGLSVAGVLATYPAGEFMGPTGAVVASAGLELAMLYLTMTLSKRVLEDMTVSPQTPKESERVV